MSDFDCCVPVGPDCRDGKHPACDGRALNEHTDKVTDCTCACHASRTIPVYVVQSEEGDVIDVTTNRAWAEHLTRDDPDNPIRTLHEDTLWDGPDDPAEWA